MKSGDTGNNFPGQQRSLTLGVTKIDEANKESDDEDKQDETDDHGR